MSNEFSHITFNFAASVLQFVDGEVGKGSFYRADIGQVTSEYHYSGGDVVIENGTGNSVLLGIGYSVPISKGIRLVYAFNYIEMTIDGQDFSSEQLALGFMW